MVNQILLNNDTVKLNKDKEWHNFAYQLIPTTQVFKSNNDNSRNNRNSRNNYFFEKEFRDIFTQQTKDGGVKFSMDILKSSFNNWKELTQNDLESFYLSCALEIMAPSFRGFFPSYLIDNTAKNLANAAAADDADKCLIYFENKLKEARLTGLSLNGCLPDLYDMNKVDNNNKYPHLPLKIIDDVAPKPEEDALNRIGTNSNWRYGNNTADVERLTRTRNNIIQFPRNSSPKIPIFENRSTKLIKGLLPYFFNYLHNQDIDKDDV